jgi:hypothetical protein
VGASWAERGWPAIIAVAGLLAASGCGSSQATVGDLLVHARSPSIGPDKTCPVPYDVSAAARAAGLKNPEPGRVAEVSVQSSEEPGASGFLTAVSPAGSVECAFQLGPVRITTYLMVTSRAKSAISGSLPWITSLSRNDDLTGWVTTAIAAAPGTVLPVPDSPVIVISLPVKGGDAALTVAPEDAGALDPVTLTQQLAAQVH